MADLIRAGFDPLRQEAIRRYARRCGRTFEYLTILEETDPDRYDEIIDNHRSHSPYGSRMSMGIREMIANPNMTSPSAITSNFPKGCDQKYFDWRFKNVPIIGTMIFATPLGRVSLTPKQVFLQLNYYEPRPIPEPLTYWPDVTWARMDQMFSTFTADHDGYSGKPFEDAIKAAADVLFASCYPICVSLNPPLDSSQVNAYVSTLAREHALDLAKDPEATLKGGLEAIEKRLAEYVRSMGEEPVTGITNLWKQALRIEGWPGYSAPFHDL